VSSGGGPESLDSGSAKLRQTAVMVVTINALKSTPLCRYLKRMINTTKSDYRRLISAWP
jgi:hypothetical protein